MVFTGFYIQFKKRLYKVPQLSILGPRPGDQLSIHTWLDGSFIVSGRINRSSLRSINCLIFTRRCPAPFGLMVPGDISTLRKMGHFIGQ
jgi:hypothetical protein